MKDLRILLPCFLIALLRWMPLSAQEPYCQNLGFELGNFTNWTGYTWRYSTDVTSINSAKVKGIVNRRQTIMSDTSAYDANTGNALKKIPSGYLFSARLGDEILSSDGNPRCWQQSLRYTMTIDSSNALLIVKFALVMQYATDHTAKVEPRFRMTLFNQKGDTIPDCSNYDVYSSNQYVKGFKTYTPTTSNIPGKVSPIEWRDWTTVGANLLKYYGQTITIEFMASDCTGRYHFGYAYFVASCHPLIINTKYCAGDSTAKLTAPEGFESYQWFNAGGAVIDTSQILTVSRPVEGDSYTCKMTSATGCLVSLQTVIAKYIPKADFTSYMIDCKSNTVQFTNLSTFTHGEPVYKWNFEDSVTSSQINPRYTFSTSGRHWVKLIIKNPPSLCADTLKKEIESFSPPLVGIKGDSTYCPNLSVFLTAYGAWDYTWNTGSKTDSIEVKAPGGTFWMIGKSSTGCTSDTIYRRISEEPDWLFTVKGDSTFCAGSNTFLEASEATKYLWSTGDTTQFLNIALPGNYSLVGANKRGCKKSFSWHILEFPLPVMDVSLSTHTLDRRHNQLMCSNAPQNDVSYVWKMGDETTETGASVQHTYSISNSTLAYSISLRATDLHGCVNRAEDIIDVVPFVPNVFSPNGDGTNDVFMADIRTQVYDRSGILLYNGTNGWDGRYNGRFVEPDTYYYIIFYPDRNQHTQTRKGYITLVK